MKTTPTERFRRSAFPTRTSLFAAITLLLTLMAGNSRATTRYVDVNSGNPSPPYTSWATAANVIQDAVDVAVAGDEIVVANGVYATGGRAVSGTMTNRVAVDKPITLRSANGPAVTVIQGRRVPGTTTGDGAIRCVYMTNGAVLSGFALTEGATRIQGDFDKEVKGAGAWCESVSAVLTNCTLTGNSAANSGGGAYLGTLQNCTLNANFAAYGGAAAWGILDGCTITGNSAYIGGGGVLRGTLNNCTLAANQAREDGGGAYLSTLNNCTLTSNTVSWYGGAAYGGTLNNCALIGNAATNAGGGTYQSTMINCTLAGNTAHLNGGGAYGGKLTNCVAYYNAAPSGSNHHGSTLDHCCTTPPPPSGVGNITNAPLFVDLVGRNLRLQSNSPCINAGINAYVSGTTDLDGRPRIVGGTVDIGVYEYQGPGMGEFIAWLQQFNLPTDGSVDSEDTDVDGHNNWQEWRADTVPTNPLSRLVLLAPTNAPVGLAVTWQSVPTRNYFLERGTNLANSPSVLSLATNVSGKEGSTTFTDTTATNGSAFFYRVGVR